MTSLSTRLVDCWMFAAGGRGLQHLVNWEGYGPEGHSWDSRSFIMDNTLLNDFCREFVDKPGRVPRGGR